MSALFISSLSLGLLYSILACGVVLTFRLLDFPDLTIDGSLVLGAVISAVSLASSWSPWLAISMSAAAGGLAGILTGLLHTRLRISKLLSGILSSTFLYSLNLRILGRANFSLLRRNTVFTLFSTGTEVFLSASLAICGVCAVRALLSTELGGAIRAVGDNEAMATGVGVPV